MKCPVDGATLTMTERSGVEIDYCPQCRGVWLDRGELDKIIDRASPAMALPEPPAPPMAPPPPQAPRVPHGDDRRDYAEKLGEWRERDERDRDDRYRSRGESDEHGRKRKRRGFLDDLFDF